MDGRNKHRFRTAKRRKMKLALFFEFCVYLLCVAITRTQRNPTQLTKMLTCCGADMHVDPAIDLSASSDNQRQCREQRHDNRYNKSDDLLPDLQTCM